ESPEDTAARLADREIAVRAGLHCAPLAHDRLGIRDGAVRVSFGAFNRGEEVREFLRVLAK
ncbi:MAG: aminotransferase class V-fold PLP-dependent enzyme, partial [Ruminococcaceae bacterium]|nr:aminotransferase class V-fold PLP-dependent enzyme [Oscillospiraceae bacterium]